MVFNNSRFSLSEEAIIKTLLYSDIFDFPMTRHELWNFLISDRKLSRQEFTDALANLSLYITQKDGYFALRDRETIIKKRKKNIPEVQKKFHIARRVVKYLSYIPTIRFIGISGGLSLGDATSDDDIDFFIITRKNTLFMTRLLVLGLLEFLGLRRKRSDAAPADKICVNLFLDESRLSWPAKKRDLYTAHEIVQVKSLFEREGTYKRFLESNTWVKNFLPNSLDEKYIFMGAGWKTDYQTLRFISFFFFSRPIEHLMRFFQEQYMQTHRTTEHVSKTLLALHPNNYRFKTLEILRSKCEKLGLLTNF